MSDIMYCTEKEVKDILLTIAKGTDEAPSVFVAFREQDKGKLQRQVTFVIQTYEGNEQLIDNITKYSMQNDMQLRFLKSDINIQGGNLTIDYVYVVATIYPNLTGD